MKTRAYVDVSFVAGAGPSSWAIELWGGGEFSHVDAVVPEWYCRSKGIPSGSLLGARSDEILHEAIWLPAGVQIRPPAYEVWPKRLVLRTPCTEDQAFDWWKFLESQIGRKYDTIGLLESFTSLLGHPRNWRDPSAWWCSELVGAAGEAGQIFQVPLPKWKLTPGDCAIAYGAAGGFPILRVGLDKWQFSTA